MRLHDTLGPAALLIAALACTPSDQRVTSTTDDGRNTTASGAEAAARDHAFVRVVNATVAGPDLTFLADERTLFEDVGAREVTDYREIDEDAVRFSVRRTDTPAAEGAPGNNEMLVDGERYTAVVLPDEQGNPGALRVLKDDLMPAAGKARIRVIHAATGTGEVDVAIAGSGDKLFSGVNFGIEAGYRDIDPVDGTLEIRREGEALKLATLKDAHFVAGTSYTIVVAGGPSRALQTIVVEDRPVSVASAGGR